MALADGVVAARHTAQRITWTDEDGTALDLTGATLSGFIRSHQLGATRSIDGTLVIFTATSGIFDWAYGTNDVGEAGNFEVQFVATFSGSSMDKTILHPWKVHEGLAIL